MKHELLSSTSSAAVAAATAVIVVEAAHIIHWDIETRSRADIDHGTARYAADPSTEALVVAFSIDDGLIEHCIPAAIRSRKPSSPPLSIHRGVLLPTMTGSRP
jgi:hypothetical protein